jgi:hypothetical protein
MRLLLTFALLAACCGVAVAQGTSAPASSSTAGSNIMAPTVGIDAYSNNPTFSTRVTGTILAVDSERRLLMIERADKSRLTFVIDPKVRISADKDTALAGRKDLSLSDYKPGSLVRVNYYARDKRAIEIRLKKSKT